MMVGWSRAEVVVSLSGVDRLLLKRVADALDPVAVPRSGPRRLREPALTVDELAVLDDVDGGWVSSEVGAVALSGDESGDDYTAFGGDVV